MAYDTKDGDITAFITFSGSVDVNTAGVYSIIYRVMDQAGNGTTKNRTITVVSNTPSTQAPLLTGAG